MNEMGGIRSRHWERSNAYRILVVKPEIKGPLVTKNRWEVDIKMEH